MTPNFELYPAFDELEAPIRVANGEVINPAAQARVDVLKHPLHRLGSVSPEDLSKRVQQFRAFLHLGRVLRSPSSRPDCGRGGSRNAMAGGVVGNIKGSKQQ